MNYLYNGVELPALPSYGSYDYFLLTPSGDSYQLWGCYGKLTYSDGGLYTPDSYWRCEWFKIFNGAWEVTGTLLQSEERVCRLELSDANYIVWSNFDIVDESDSSVYFPASDPVPVGGATPETPDPKSMLTAWLVGRRIAKQRAKGVTA